MVSWKQRENIIAENMVNVRKRSGLGVNFFAMFNSVSALHFCACQVCGCCADTSNPQQFDKLLRRLYYGFIQFTTIFSGHRNYCRNYPASSCRPNPVRLKCRFPIMFHKGDRINAFFSFQCLQKFAALVCPQFHNHMYHILRQVSGLYLMIFAIF